MLSEPYDNANSLFRKRISGFTDQLQFLISAPSFDFLLSLNGKVHICEHFIVHNVKRLILSREVGSMMHCIFLMFACTSGSVVRHPGIKYRAMLIGGDVHVVAAGNVHSFRSL